MKCIEGKYCTGCGACAAICPCNAIIMNSDELGFKYPHINKDKCAECDVCQKICPAINSKPFMQVDDFSATTYAAWSKDKKLQKNSSSGGIFGEMAEYILKDNGIVFGAAFNSGMELQHIAVKSLEELPRILGSKYLQSDINDSYLSVKQYLSENKKVLFSGTACQVAGLYAFLGSRNNPNLFTVDILCHGVPSPEIFRQHLLYIENKYFNGEKAKEYFFRNKTLGWKNYCTLAKSSNYKYRKLFYEDYFMHGFLKNYYLRESCYHCQYAKKQRIADITLGDFWGYEQHDYKKFNHDRGASLIIVSSMQGKLIFDAIKEHIWSQEVSIEDCVKYNPILTSPSNIPVERDKILTAFSQAGWVNAIKFFKLPPRTVAVKALCCGGRFIYSFFSEILPWLKCRLTGKH